MDFLESLSVDEYLDVLIDLLDLYREFEHFERAISVCERILASDSLKDKAIVLLQMGFIYGKMGVTDKEIQAYVRVLELDPTNKKARFRLSEIYDTEGRYNEAIKILGNGIKRSDRRGALGRQRPVKRLNETRDRFRRTGERTKNKTKRYGRNLDDGDEGSGSSQEDGEEEEVEIFLSDDEGTKVPKKNTFKPSLLVKRAPERGDQTAEDLLPLTKLESIQPDPSRLHIKSHKVEKLIKDIKGEEALSQKTRRRMVNIIELNEQFFINVQKHLDDLAQKYGLEVLLLSFKQVELGLKADSSDPLLDFKAIKRALQLEQRKISFRESLYQLLLNENKGKIKSAFQGMTNDDAEFKKEFNYLFIFKRKKHLDSEKSRLENLFKESKNKSRVAKKLSQKLVSKMKTISDYVGFSKFVEILDSALRAMYSQQKYHLLSQVCEILFKITKAFDSYTNFQALFYFYGFLCNSKIENFEKAYVFFRVMSKHLIRDENVPEPTFNPVISLPAPKAPVLKEQISTQSQLTENGLPAEISTAHHAYSLRQSFLSLFAGYTQLEINSLCFTMINHLFNEFSQHISSHRIFFQKFQTQFSGEGSVRRFVNQISANNYIVSGSSNPAKVCLLGAVDLETSALGNFLMGYITLTESTNRNNDNKIEKIQEAFDYFERYKELSPGSKLPEVYYNLGRAFSHLGIVGTALRLFAKSKAAVDDRLIQERNLLESVSAKTGKKIDPQKLNQREREIKLKGLYHESTFNQLVWQHKTHNKAIEYSIFNSGFC